jgi:hypothetical protein
MGKYAAIVQMDCETGNIERNKDIIISLAVTIKAVF